MIGKRLYAVSALSFALCSCGTDTPPDAVIKVVEANRTTTYTLNTAPTKVVDGVIHFRVETSATNPSPVHDASVELSGSSPSVGDPGGGFVGTLSVGGPFLNPGDPNHVFMTTDSSGVVSALYQFTVPACATGAGAVDLVVSATISASIGGSTATWIDTITITKC